MSGSRPRAMKADKSKRNFRISTLDKSEKCNRSSKKKNEKANCTATIVIEGLSIKKGLNERMNGRDTNQRVLLGRSAIEIKSTRGL